MCIIIIIAIYCTYTHTRDTVYSPYKVWSFIFSYVIKARNLTQVFDEY